MQVLTVPLTFRFNGSFERAGFVYMLLRLTHGLLNVKCCYVKWQPRIKSNNPTPQADTEDGWNIWILTTVFRSTCFTLKCDCCLMRSVWKIQTNGFILRLLLPKLFNCVQTRMGSFSASVPGLLCHLVMKNHTIQKQKLAQWTFCYFMSKYRIYSSSHLWLLLSESITSHNYWNNLVEFVCEDFFISVGT